MSLNTLTAIIMKFDRTVSSILMQVSILDQNQVSLLLEYWVRNPRTTVNRGKLTSLKLLKFTFLVSGLNFKLSPIARVY